VRSQVVELSGDVAPTASSGDASGNVSRKSVKWCDKADFAGAVAATSVGSAHLGPSHDSELEWLAQSSHMFGTPGGMSGPQSREAQIMPMRRMP
jgi:hypothetical protein